jgi:hypothetical protein
VTVCRSGYSILDIVVKRSCVAKYNACERKRKGRRKDLVTRHGLTRENGMTDPIRACRLRPFWPLEGSSRVCNRGS